MKNKEKKMKLNYSILVSVTIAVLVQQRWIPSIRSKRG